jgi:hypothetical protein
MTKVAAPLTERQAARIAPLGLLADEPFPLAGAWHRVETMWTPTVDRARRLAPDALDARVNGEWSFLQTLRHLIFVTDAWVADVVLELPDPFDPIGLPPDFITNGTELGLDLAAMPTFAHVLACRARKMTLMRDTLELVTSDELARPCERFDGQFTALGAFQNVIFEEWAHHQYATRDLASLEESTEATDGGV